MKSPSAHGPGVALRRALAVVPARLGSTRLERKMLLAESGKFLFQHTVESVRRCSSIERVVLATDSDEIVAAATEAGVDVLRTSDQHPSGTDRVNEACQKLQEAADRPWDVVLNVQGDEPEIDPNDLERLIAAFDDETVNAATLWGAVRSEEEALDPSVVKVVCNARGDALYFTRCSAPSRSHSRTGAGGWESVRRHIGVYAYRPDALARFCTLPASPLERTENLEQLRWLEAGESMRTVEARSVPRGIDTREDYEQFLLRWNARDDLQRTTT